MVHITAIPFLLLTGSLTAALPALPNHVSSTPITPTLPEPVANNSDQAAPSTHRYHHSTHKQFSHPNLRGPKPVSRAKAPTPLDNAVHVADNLDPLGNKEINVSNLPNDDDHVLVVLYPEPISPGATQKQPAANANININRPNESFQYTSAPPAPVSAPSPPESVSPDTLAAEPQEPAAPEEAESPALPQSPLVPAVNNNININTLPSFDATSIEAPENSEKQMQAGLINNNSNRRSRFRGGSSSHNSRSYPDKNEQSRSYLPYGIGQIGKIGNNKAPAPGQPNVDQPLSPNSPLAPYPIQPMAPYASDMRMKHPSPAADPRHGNGCTGRDRKELLPGSSGPCYKYGLDGKQHGREGGIAMRRGQAGSESAPVQKRVQGTRSPINTPTTPGGQPEPWNRLVGGGFMPAPKKVDGVEGGVQRGAGWERRKIAEPEPGKSRLNGGSGRQTGVTSQNGVLREARPRGGRGQQGPRGPREKVNGFCGI